MHDPQAIENARRAWPELRCADSVRAAAAGAELVLLLTDWPEYAGLSPDELAEVTAARALGQDPGGQ
ncbi:MAG: UDP binding domain-containing protein [Streptosporangiaceae bacterium]